MKRERGSPKNRTGRYAEAQDGRAESRLHQERLAAAGPGSLVLVWGPSHVFPDLFQSPQERGLVKHSSE